MKIHSVFEMIPETWAIEFKNRDTAHLLYDKVKNKYDENLGTITVNNDTWYIGTKLSDEKLKKEIIKFLDQCDISESKYSIEKTEAGKFWTPF